MLRPVSRRTFLGNSALAVSSALAAGGLSTGPRSAAARLSAQAEGDTLVIRATGFNDQTFLDSSGLPHSDQLLTTERIRRLGNQLEVVVTIHDPGYYTRDFQARFVYERRNGLRLQEYACGDPHRDISGVKGIREVRAARAQGRFP